MFIRFDTIHERDGQTDARRQTHTQTLHDDIARACIASSGKRGCSNADIWHWNSTQRHLYCKQTRYGFLKYRVRFVEKIFECYRFYCYA